MALLFTSHRQREPQSRQVFVEGSEVSMGASLETSRVSVSQVLLHSWGGCLQMFPKLPMQEATMVASFVAARRGMIIEQNGVSQIWSSFGQHASITFLKHAEARTLNKCRF